ncbi:translation initiation factor IF-2 subunit gamma [Candidatus Woesearchaeota archaeon]|nr:translation initiation factor IF-2 subunit gamma [Candidatus Woesearchaeota archaeon]
MPKQDKIIQPEINIGLVGHVDHGKTTLVSKLSGKWTDTHSEEIKRGITIRLGYANASIYECKKCKKFVTRAKCPDCGSDAVFVRKVSFIDAPGHETLMATMLSGAAIMDAALLLVSAEEICPQPQTKEHLTALEIIGLKNIIIVQNKIDLVSKEDAIKNYKQIKEFVKGTIAEKSPIIPISAQFNINIDKLINAIQETFKTPKREDSKEPLFFVARSFDINRPGSKIEKLFGGVLGGALKQGKFKIDDTIIIKPGRKVERQGRVFWEPLKTKIVGLRTGEEDIKEIHPGGSSALLTLLDPSIVKSDTLIGSIVGVEGKMPETREEINLKIILLERVVGVKEETVVEPVKRAEILMLNVNSSATVGIVIEQRKDYFKLKLKLPICCNKEDRITISRRIGNRFRLIGYGNLVE